MNRIDNINWTTIRPSTGDLPPLSPDALSDKLVGVDDLRHLVTSASADEPILLIANDPHRSTRTREILVALATCLHRWSVRPDFRLLVGTGTHQFEQTEMRTFEHKTIDGCGLSIRAIAWHDARDGHTLSPLAGVGVHKWLAESSRVIPIGSVEPHYFGGVTGPHKTVTVGCMAKEDIERNHAHAISPESDLLKRRGNPVFDGLAGILARMVDAGKRIVSIAEVVCDDAILDVAVGDTLQTVETLCDLVERIYVQRVARAADVLHLNVPLPLGRNLYQADKALKNNHLAVRDGGGIVLEAACGEGIGPGAFVSLLRETRDYAHAVAVMHERGYRLSDHKAIKLRHLIDPKCRHVRVAVVTSGLSEQEMRGTGLHLFGETQAALAWLQAGCGGDLATGLVIEDAGMVTTMIRCDGA